MNIQSIVENAINDLVGEFLQNPFAFFTEADAVSRFHQLLVENPTLNQNVRTSDGYEVSLVHREYPTFFRFSDEDATERLPPPAKRGHYDTVILNPEFVKAYPATTVTNRSFKDEGGVSVTPFQAIVEFKLDNQGWSAGRTLGAITELRKLNLSTEAPFRYFVVFMRYTSPKMTRWNKYWHEIKQVAETYSEIGSVFAIHWLSSIKKGENVFQFGRWLI